MEEPIIILSDDEEESQNKPPISKEIKKTSISKEQDQVVFPVKSKSGKNTNCQRQVFTWFLCHKFESHQEAAEYILGEKVWSRWYNSTTESGAKQYYRCNRVKYSAKQCSARIYTRFSPNSPEVFLFTNNLEHDHQKSEDPSPHHRNARTPAHVKAGLPHQKEAISSAKVLAVANAEKNTSSRTDHRRPFHHQSDAAHCSTPDFEPDDEFDEDCGDEDDEDSFFIDTSLLRVEIEEEPEDEMNTFKDTFNNTFGKNSDQSYNESLDLTFNHTFEERRNSSDDSSEDDDIVFVDEQQTESDGPSMKIAKIESHFNIDQFILNIPKQKFTRMNWHQVHTFASSEEARNYILTEKIWSKWYFSHTETGAKQYYRCNKAKYSGRQCAARIYLFYESNSDEVHLMVNGNKHDHDSTEVRATYSALPEDLKAIVQKCCELKQKPKDIITKLEALNLPLPSRYHLRKYIVELQEKL